MASCDATRAGSSLARWGGHVSSDDLRDGTRIVLVAASTGDGRDDPPALVAWRARHPALEAVDRRAYCLGVRCAEALVVAVLRASGRARIPGTRSTFAVADAVPAVPRRRGGPWPRRTRSTSRSWAPKDLS